MIRASILSLVLLTGAAMAQTTQPAATTQPAVPPPAPPPAPEKSDVPSPRDAKWCVNRHEDFLAQAAKGGCDLLFLGDSITDGWNKAPAWKEYYAPINALNFGLSGDQTQHLLWRITNGELEGIKPKVVVLMIGTNNAGDSPEAIVDGVTAIVKTIRTKLPESKLLLLGIFPRSADPKNYLRAKLAGVNETLAKLDDGKNIKYLDIGKCFLDADGAIPKEVMSDGLHPTPMGYELWAQAMNPTLGEMLGRKIEKVEQSEKKDAAPATKPMP